MTSVSSVSRVLVLVTLLVLLAACATKDSKPADDTDPGDFPRIAVVLPTRQAEENTTAEDVMIGINRLARDFDGTIHGRNEVVEFGGRAEFHVRVTDDLETAGVAGLTDQLRVIADEGFDLVVCSGYHYAEPILEMHGEAPDTLFVGIDAYYEYPDDSNILCLTFDPSGAAFLAGAMAADRFGGRPLGAIGGQDLEFLRNQFIAPFVRGVEYMDARNGTRTDVAVAFGDGFGNYEQGYAMAEEMIADGVQCVYQAAGYTGFGVMDAMRDAGLWAVGVDTDQGLQRALWGEEHAHILTSTVKRWGNGVYLVVSEYLETGRLPRGVQKVGLAEGCTEFAVNPYNAPILGEQLSLVEELENRLISGELSAERSNEDIDSAEEVWTTVEASPAVEILTVTVNDPILSPGIPAHYGAMLQEALSTEFLNVGFYRVINRDQVNRLLNEINFSLDGVTEESRRLEVGRLVAAEAVVFVNIGDVGQSINVDCKLVDVETGLMISAARDVYNDFENVLDDAGSLVRSLGQR